ncbi:MAG: nitroreductase family protein [Desulfobacterales bacterium]
MTEFTQVLEERRSIRRYEEKEVPEALLNQVLDAIKWSPSWANTQCWEIVVVKDQDLKEKVQAAVPSTNPAYRSMASAPVVLAVCGKLKQAGYYNDAAVTKFDDWAMFDLGIATQSLCLAAQNAGLGTVIAGMFDHDKAKAALNVPEGYDLFCLVPMGYAAKTGPAPPRRGPDEFAHHGTFKS